MTANMLNCEIQNVLGEMWQEAYRKGRSLSFKIVSGSMNPVVRAGDVVRVSRADPSRIRIGDIVAFKKGQNVMVHRIIGKSSSNAGFTFRQMADAGGPSGNISAQDIIGRVIAIEKEEHEIRLDTQKYIIGNIILGWRLLLIDTLRQMQPGHGSTVIRLALRPVWRLYRGLLFWKL